MSTYSTRNVGLASLLCYLFTPGVHLRTIRDERGVIFEFNDLEAGRCHEVMQLYQGETGGDGFAVTDAKAYADEFFEVRRTVSAANAKGEWVNTSPLLMEE